jgi:hypothetical protein
MPFFKKKPERSTRLEELEAHVRNIRRIAAEDPKGAGALQSFLVEDGYWDQAAADLEAQAQTRTGLAHPGQSRNPQPPQPARMQPAQPTQRPATSPEANIVTAETVEHVQPRSEEEAMLEAELQRYLARIAEESAPDPDEEYPEDEFAR